MIILGIDPGIATMGYGVVDKDKNGNCRAVDYGVVVTPKEETLPVRLAMLEEGVGKIIDKFSPKRSPSKSCFSPRTSRRASPSPTPAASSCSPASSGAANCTNTPPCRSNRR